jgi:hypothetical protein
MTCNAALGDIVSYTSFVWLLEDWQQTISGGIDGEGEQKEQGR